MTMAAAPGLVLCFDSPGFGGSEINLLRALSMGEWQISAVVHGTCVAPEVLRALEARMTPMVAVSVGNSWRSSLSALVQARRVTKRFPGRTFLLWAHHVDSFRWLQLWLAATGRPFVVVEQLVPASARELRRSRLTIPMKRFVANRAAAVVLNGASQREHYQRLFGCDGRALRVVGSSRDVLVIWREADRLRTDKAALRSSLGLRPDALLIGCVGRLTGQKRQEDLIQGAALLAPIGRHVQVVLVGDGPNLGSLQRLAAQTGVEAIFAGTQRQVLTWLAALDVFVLPSASEGLPGALIEALAAGVPTIATNIPGNRDLVKHGDTGLLVDVGRPEQIARAIEEIARDPAMASKLARRGRELVRAEYDSLREAEAWRSIRDLGGQMRAP